MCTHGGGQWFYNGDGGDWAIIQAGGGGFEEVDLRIRLVDNV